MKPSPSQAPGHQTGAVLVVALILLVVMTLLGLSSVRTVLMEERMTANAFDRSLAFQTAEAALRAGEIAAQAQADAVPPNSSFDNGGTYTDANSSCGASPCSNGLCSQPDKDCTARWLDDSFDSWTDASDLDLTELATTAQYIVEFLGDDFPCNIDDPTTGAQDCKRYRITARSGDGEDNRSVVMLQSIYATE